jgi:hypothetical protein
MSPMPSHTRPAGQHCVALQSRKRQYARLSPIGARGRISIGLSGHSGLTLVLMSEPHTPRVEPVTRRKQIPRQGEGFMPEGIVQGEPSGRPAGLDAAIPHEPVRALHIMPAGHWSLVAQKGKQPARSGPPERDAQKPVQTCPGRQPVFSEAGLQALAQSDCSIAPSPDVRQVVPEPPHCSASFAWLALFTHGPLQ